MFVRASKHHFHRDTNKTKLVAYSAFIAEYRRVSGLILSDMWDNGYSWSDKQGNQKLFFVSKGYLDVPRFIDYKKFKVETSLSARALSSLVVQLAAVISASVEKQRRRLYVAASKGSSAALDRVIAKNKPVKPDVSRLCPELSSKCCDFMETAGEFYGFLQLKSIGDFGKIRIPVRQHRQSSKWSLRGRRMSSFLLHDDYVNIRWEMSDVPLKTKGLVVGADQGVKTTLTLSDGQTTDSADRWTLDKVTDLVARKRKGSKAFSRAQQLRKCVIGRDLNRLRLENIKEVRLEKIVNIFYGKNASRKLKAFTNTIIRDKMQALCQENGVRFVEQECTYRSQRCSVCGWVRKANRKAKVFTCNSCGHRSDADLNAAMNHEQDLPDVPVTLRRAGLNRAGFFWKPDGFFTVAGQELGVSVDTTIN